MGLTIAHEADGKTFSLTKHAGTDDLEKLKRENKEYSALLREASDLIKQLDSERNQLRKEVTQLREELDKRNELADNNASAKQPQRDAEKLKPLSKRIREFQARHSLDSHSKVTVGEWDPAAKRWKT